MVQTPPVPRAHLVRVLHEDPDLARRLDEAEVPTAARQVVGVLEEIAAGPWRPVKLDDGKCLYGGLILSGLIARELSLGTGTSAELLGTGDLVLPLDADETVPFVEPQITWDALEPTRIAWLDASFGVALRRWPELAAGLLERSQRRFRRLALSQACSQLTRVDDRVLLQLWHLAERWGRVRADGILLPVRLTHRVLARLVGARRPSVTTALGSLERRELLRRLPDGGFLLLGNPPAALAQSEPARQGAPWHHARTGAAGLERVQA